MRTQGGAAHVHFHLPPRARAVTFALVALAFFGLDVLAVVLALAWLSRRRAMADPTDMRFRGRRPRAG